MCSVSSLAKLPVFFFFTKVLVGASRMATAGRARGVGLDHPRPMTQGSDVAESRSGQHASRSAFEVSGEESTTRVPCRRERQGQPS